jgi:hypothetical protein
MKDEPGIEHFPPSAIEEIEMGRCLQGATGRPIPVEGTVAEGGALAGGPGTWGLGAARGAVRCLGSGANCRWVNDIFYFILFEYSLFDI